MARVAALLSQYYAADVPPSVVSIMAEDWKEELAPYPQWAITSAVRWWKSEANPDRKRRPLEGDISARAKHEMMLVRLASHAVQRYWDGYRPSDLASQPQRPELTAEEKRAARVRADQYIKEAGLNLKRAAPSNEAAAQ